MMNMYIVTIKLPRNPDHDPKNKITGLCPFSNACSDSTGAHHSFLSSALTEEDARQDADDRGFKHVTRVERIGN